MVIKMPLSSELVPMVFYALLLRLELETLPLEVLDVLINFAWKTRNLMAHMMTPPPDVVLKIGFACSSFCFMMLRSFVLPYILLLLARVLLCSKLILVM
jgi:hypothetical protein